MANKPPLEYLPLDALEAVAGLIGWGLNSEKHKGDNFENHDISIVKYKGKAMRHLSEFYDKGIDNDPETGYCHLVAAIVDLLIAWKQFMAKPETDDRKGGGKLSPPQANTKEHK